MTTTERMPSPRAAMGPIVSAEVVDAEFAEAPSRHLRDHLRVLYKYRWLAGACFAVAVGAAILVTLLTPRLYTAATRVQVSGQSPIQLRLDENVLRVGDDDRTVNGGSSFLASQVAILQSRDLAERVIRGRRLAEHASFLDPGAARGGLLAIGGRLLSTVRPRGLDAPAQSAETLEAGGESPAPALLDRYMRWLAVRDLRGTDLVEIRFTTPSPQLSAFLAAAHTQAYIESNEEARLATNATAKEFLGRQLRESRKHVEDAEAALARFAGEHPAVAVDHDQKLAAQRIGELGTLISKAEGTRLGLESRIELLDQADPTTLAAFLDQPGVQKLHLAALEVAAQRAALAERLGPNHPQMLELGRQQSALDDQLRAELTEERSALSAKLAAARAKQSRLEVRLGEQEQAAVELRDLGARYALLAKDVDTAHALHESLLKQQLETAVNSELAASNIRIVERAEVPVDPSRPNVPLNLMLGVLAGLGLAVGAAFVCEYFDRSVKSGEEVEDLLQIAALATIPNFALARRQAPRALLAAAGDGPPPGGPGPELVVLHEPWSVVSEAFRSLRTQVLFSRTEGPPRVILLTSAGAGEGKTVSSLNLATTLADSGSRVLLIDVDLRRPSCHRALRIENERGLSSYLAGQVSLDEAIRRLDAPRLSFIPAGPMPPNPAELVGSARMRETLADLRGQYDFIILDSPPTLPVTDAVVLAREADGVVLVVKGHDTPRELVRKARDQLVAAGARMLGAVVNNVDLGWGDLYFYNRYYGYHRLDAVVEEAA